MARYVTNENRVPIYPTSDGDHPFNYLDLGTEVGTIGDPVNGPPGHGQIVKVLVILTDDTGWVYMSLLTPQ